MALLNYSKKEINAKIVYYGPGLSGKTTNIQFIYKKLKPEHRGKLMTLATQTDRTLFFDFLPVELGDIKGLKTRFQIYTVPGQVYYNATRKLVLKNVDGIVFVADSQKKMLNENIESLKNLEENLMFYNRNIKDLPIVFQYNKRDLHEILSVEELQNALNHSNAPYFESVAHRGQGVLQVLTTVSKLVLQRLRTTTEFTRIDAERPEPEVQKKAPPPTMFSPPEQEPEKSVEIEIEPAPAIMDADARSTLSWSGNRPGVEAKVNADAESGIQIGEPRLISRGRFNIPLTINLENGKTRTLSITITIEG